jgi:hypothetical protein
MIKKKKGRKPKLNKEMKTLQVILAELQAADVSALNVAQTAVAQTITDLQAYIAGTPVPADPVATIVTTTVAGVVVTFIPQV